MRKTHEFRDEFLVKHALMSQQTVTATADKPTVLVVDDAPENLTILAKILKDDYRVKLACNGAGL